jgi:predicted nucleotidyltransferase
MLFGSVLRDDFSPTSDIDLLIQFRPGTVHSLFKRDEMLHDFRSAFDREIDLVNYEGILASRNERRKRNILSSAQEFYVVRPQS